MHAFNKISLMMFALAWGLAGCAARSDDWPMWGGTPARTLFSPGKDPPVMWDVEKNWNVKWAAQLGSKSYGNPVVCDGVVYVGTNNESHRDPAFLRDAGVLMA